MKMGTKSILFGVHNPVLHTPAIAWSWIKLYGFPWDPRIWVAFLVHDLGYWGKPNMDGPEGEKHVELGANIMNRLFGRRWWRFCIYHSRFYARKADHIYSPLCFADKLAICFWPWWVYLSLANLTGEIHEYMSMPKHREELKPGPKTQRQWYTELNEHMQNWVKENRY